MAPDWEVNIPAAFWTVAYDGARYPGASGVKGLAGGANCQQFAYELLRSNGFVIGDLRSSELWADTAYTGRVTAALAPADLLLFNRTADPFGAHVAVYLGEDRAVHLSKQVGKPVIWSLSDFSGPLYACFIGAKRPLRRSASAV